MLQPDGDAAVVEIETMALPGLPLPGCGERRNGLTADSRWPVADRAGAVDKPLVGAAVIVQEEPQIMIAEICFKAWHIRDVIFFRSPLSEAGENAANERTEGAKPTYWPGQPGIVRDKAAQVF